jgi:hypothetical protein
MKIIRTNSNYFATLTYPFWPQKFSHFFHKNSAIFTPKIQPFWPQKFSHFFHKNSAIFSTKITLIFSNFMLLQIDD